MTGFIIKFDIYESLVHYKIWSYNLKDKQFYFKNYFNYSFRVNKKN